MNLSKGRSGIRNMTRVTGLSLMFVVVAHATTVMTLDPLNGAVQGSPGQTVGWGFTFANDTNWALLNTSAFCTGTGHTAADLLTAACTTNPLGTYTDYLGAQFLVVGPGNPPDPNGGPTDMISVTEVFDAVSQGVGQFVINAGANNADSTSGELLVLYDLYSVSPNNASFDPSTDLISTDNFFAIQASVTVQSVPEPTTLLLAGSALAGLAFVRFRRRR